MFQICFTVLCRPLAWYCLSDKTALLVSFSHEIPSLCYLIETFLFLCTVACKSDIQNSFVFTFWSRSSSMYYLPVLSYYEGQTRIQQAMILFLEVNVKFLWSQTLFSSHSTLCFLFELIVQIEAQPLQRVYANMYTIWSCSCYTYGSVPFSNME